MKIDFHTHVKFTKKIDFSLEYFLSMVKEARHERLDAFTLTEHFNTDQFYEIYKTFDEQFQYENGYYDVDGFKVFPGMEINIQEGGHVLFTGDRYAVKELREQLEPYTTDVNFIRLEHLFQISEPYRFMKIGAHPFREANPLFNLPEDLLKQFDAFDLNGKDLNAYGVKRMKEKVYDFAFRLGKPVVAGSDAHHPLQIACVYNKFKVDCHTVEELRQAISSGGYKVKISDDLSLRVRAAKTAKNLLKENWQLRLASRVLS